MTASPLPIRRALISVSDKSGIVAFAEALAARGVTIISTGGSAQTLAAAEIPVTEVAEVTGMAEFLDGRVKTLHPVIHAGLLARRDRPDHTAALAQRQIAPIDLLVCNLYPFAQTVASGRAVSAWRARGSSRVRSCPTIIMAMPTPPSSWSQNLDRLPLRSSNTPTRAV